MKQGQFVVLEGIEGAGKSTHTRFLTNWLQEQGVPVVAAREPGGTPVGERLRNILLDPALAGLSAEAELLLMFAARSASIREVIRPALEQGSWVICDRFVDSSYAYQGYGRGIPLDYVATLERQVLGGLRPDLTILLDAPVSLALARKGGPGGRDRFESESAEFFERVRSGYLRRAADGGARYRTVDASRPVDAVRQNLVDLVRQTLRSSN